MSDPSANTGGWSGSYVEPVLNPTTFSMTVVRSGSNFNLSWTGAPICLYYNIYSGIEPSEMGLTQTELNSILANAVVPSGANTSVFYWFQVEAVISNTSSVFSNIAPAK